jgi:hypothetical protein
MRIGSLPPAALMRPWFSVGEVAERLPVMLAHIPPIEPAEDQSGLGAVGQPYAEPDAGLPAMSEASLIQAHRACTCCPQPERMPWESWSPGQWAWRRRRQRVMAQREIQRETRREKEGAA